jgi:hypothetical protein
MQARTEEMETVLSGRKGEWDMCPSQKSWELDASVWSYRNCSGVLWTDRRREP